MTKPLVQLLAERAGIQLTDGRLSREDSQASLLLFELCAYLDEREKAPRPVCDYYCAECELYMTRGEARGHVCPEPPAPETLTRAEQKRPPPPDELVGALHDPIHPPSGNLISASPVRVVRRGNWDTCLDCGAYVPEGKSCVNHEPPAAPEVAEPGHVFDAGTPEAIRDAKLRNDVFSCVEQHPTEPRIATWHYWKALQLVSDYRAAITAEARADLASRCDHHAAIHELNRELVEAREALARVEAELREEGAKTRAALSAHREVLVRGGGQERELRSIRELCASLECQDPGVDCADRTFCMVEELRQRRVCQEQHLNNERELSAELTKAIDLSASRLADAKRWRAERDECDKLNDAQSVELAKAATERDEALRDAAHWRDRFEALSLEGFGKVTAERDELAAVVEAAKAWLNADDAVVDGHAELRSPNAAKGRVRRAIAKFDALTAAAAKPDILEEKL